MGVNIGGVASKLGNRYEAKWLVRELLGVLGGDADWLQFEGITAEFNGFEAAVCRAGRTEWHQTKSNAPGGNWTIGALKREGVLTAFAKRLSVGANNLCIFASQSPARDLLSLSDKARLANNNSEFQSALNHDERASLKVLEDVWRSDPSKTHEWLSRCSFRTASVEVLDNMIATLGNLYFERCEAAFAVLRDHLEDHLNKPITIESLRAALQVPLGLKHWGLNPSLRQRLTEETNAYLATFPVLAEGGRGIDRKESALIDEILAKEDGPSVVLLTGVAGAGKSGVVAGLIERLRDHDIPHLALRVDQHLTSRSPQDLGHVLLGRDESPAVTLKGLSGAAQAVLIIDQVDAISEVSGRQGAVREAILRLVSQVESLKTVRLVLACRSFDLDSDSRLKQLKDGQRVTEVSVPLLDWSSEVEPLLADRDINGADLSSRQRDLLCLPLNLGLFLELRADAGAFASRSDLFERLLERKDRAIRTSRSPSWSLLAVLGRLVEWMSDRQKLDAPISVLDEFSGALDVLVSEHLIVKGRSSINLFHESLFDYIFARQFAARSQSLHDLLVSSEQHLFRRTQTRQILEALRQLDRARYCRELREILASTRIRYHIKQAVALWLSSLRDPTNDECHVVIDLDDRSAAMPQLVSAALLGSSGWFDLLFEIGWLKEALNTSVSERREPILHWLDAIAEHRAASTAALLDQWWSRDPSRGQALLAWLGFVRRGPDDQPLRELCERAIRACASEGSLGFLDRHDMILSNWVRKRPEQAVGIVRALFDAWFDAHPGQHPFERNEIRELDLHDFKEMAKASPKAFLEGAAPALLRSVAAISERKRSGAQDYTFLKPCRTGDVFGADAFVALYRQSLKRVATEAPEAARCLLKQFDPRSHWLLLHLHLEAIAASDGLLTEEFLVLVDIPEIFEAGWQGAEWKSFADAARTCLPHMSQADCDKVERKIVTMAPELENARDLLREIRISGEDMWRDRATVRWWLSRTGHSRWAILETIGAPLLSTAARALLDEGRRKFAGEPVPAPTGMTGGWVKSPIPRERAAFMSDAHWLRAMEKHATNDGRPRRRALEGGAWQLSGELQHVTKSEAERFAALLSHIPASANTIYVDRILSGLAEAEAVSVTVLAGAIKNAHDRDGRPHGSAIARIFERHPKLGDNAELRDVLLWYAEHGVVDDSLVTENSSTKEEIVTLTDLLQAGSRLHIRGINGVRGSAAEALGRVLWEAPSAEEAAWRFVERRIKAEPLDSVRCCLVQPLLPLFNVDRDRVTQLLLDLTMRPCAPRSGVLTDMTDSWLAPLATHAATELLPYLVAQRPQAGGELVNRLLNSENDEFRLIGAWHVVRASYEDANYIVLADQLATTDVRSRRLAASLAASAVMHQEFRDRAERRLINCFHDDDGDVQAQAAQVFRNIASGEFQNWRTLADAYVASPAFDQESWGFLHLLEKVAGDTGELVVAAAERVIADLQANGTAGGRRTSELHDLQELIRRDYASTEGDENLRGRLLDVIDRMLERSLYGAESITKAHERA